MTLSKESLHSLKERFISLRERGGVHSLFLNFYPKNNHLKECIIDCKPVAFCVRLQDQLFVL